MFAFVPTVVAPKSLASAAASAAISSSHPLVQPAAASPSVQPRPLADAASQRVAAGSPAGPSGVGHRGSRVLVWLDGSLRLDDNEALHKTLSRNGNGSSSNGNVALAVLAPRAGDAVATAAVHDLAREIAARGGHLLVLPRSARAVVDACEQLRLKTVALNRATTRDGAQLQGRVCDAARAAGLKVEAYWGEHVTEPREEWLRGGTKGEKGKKNNKGRGNGEDVTPQEVLSEMTARGANKSFGGAPEKLPGPVAGSARVTTVALAKTPGAEGGAAAVRKVLGGMRRDTEMLAIETTAETCVLVKPLLDCGAVSPRAVMQRVREVVGRVQGHTAAELAFRTAMSMRVHRELGVTSVSTTVAA